VLVDVNMPFVGQLAFWLFSTDILAIEALDGIDMVI